jgi:hypothetical protein
MPAGCFYGATITGVFIEVAALGIAHLPISLLVVQADLTPSFLERALA